MDNILKRLNDEYLSDLKAYEYLNKNHHYYGYSERFNDNVFIKIYGRFDKYDKDTRVLKIRNPEILLDNFIYEDYYIICLKYVDMEDVSADTCSISDCGKLIAKFHKKTTAEIELADSFDLAYDIESKMEKIKARENSYYINRVYKLVKKYEPDWVNEFENIPKKIIHGDFGFRNIKIIDGNLELIDFEFLKKSIAYIDFIKFFEDIKISDKDREEFISAYNTVYHLDVPSDLLIRVLDFQTALGIYSYTMKIKDVDFEKMADRMMEKVEEFF